MHPKVNFYLGWLIFLCPCNLIKQSLIQRRGELWWTVDQPLTEEQTSICIIPGLQQCQSDVSAYSWRHASVCNVSFCSAEIYHDLACNMHISCTIMEQHMRCNWASHTCRNDCCVLELHLVPKYALISLRHVSEV